MVNFDELIEAILKGDGDATFELTQNALKENVPAHEILDSGLIPGLQQVCMQIN